MPVTINGDGHISGLVVGGLPNGSVDANTLASNAVTSTKLHNDAVTTSHMPTGSVIQTVQHNFTTGNFTTASNSYVDITGFSQAITPLAASSKILVILSAAIYASPNGTYNGQVGVSVNRSVAGGSYTAVASQMPGSYIQETYTRYFHISYNNNFLDSPSYSLGDAITYKLQMKSADTSVTSGMYVSIGGVTNGANKLILLEVAG